MVKYIFSILFLVFSWGNIQAEELHLSSVSVGGNYGTVLESNEFVEGDNKISHYTTQTLKLAMRLSPDMWQKEFFGDPYYGIGISLNQFGRSEDLGNPVGIYLLQGARLASLASKLELCYELNLGVITGWEEYDKATNIENVAIGSNSSVLVMVDLYLNYRLSRHMDLHLGASLFHTSNGSYQHPNMGINAYNIYAEVSYNFNLAEEISTSSSAPEVPQFKPHFEHDVEFICTTRNSKDIVSRTAIAEDENNRYNERHFPLLGVVYKFMRAPNHKYRYGIGAEMLYDESSFAVCSISTSGSGEQSMSYTLAPVEDRISVGMAIHGEIVKPYYSVFANVGYSLYQPSTAYEKLYQTAGVKIDILKDLYGSFGVRAEGFTKAKFLYLSLGYSFSKRK